VQRYKGLKNLCFTSPFSKYLAPFCVVDKTPCGLQLKEKGIRNDLLARVMVTDVI
jgi:hypothetical protein